MRLTNRVSIKNIQQKIKLHLQKIGRKLSLFHYAYPKSMVKDYTSSRPFMMMDEMLIILNHKKGNDIEAPLLRVY